MFKKLQIHKSWTSNIIWNTKYHKRKNIHLPQLLDKRLGKGSYEKADKGTFGTITKGLLKGLEDLEVGGRVETIQITVLLRTARILRRVLETWGNLLTLKIQWKTIS